MVKEMVLDFCNKFVYAKEKGSYLHPNEMKAIEDNGLTRKRFLQGLSSGKTNFCLKFPFLLDKDHKYIQGIINHEENIHSIHKMVEHYCNVSSFMLHYGKDYPSSLKKMAQENKIISPDLVLQDGHLIKIPLSSLKTKIKKEALSKKKLCPKMSQKLNFQSPFGGKTSHRIKSSDKFKAIRGKFRHAHSGLDLKMPEGSKLYPLKPGRVVGAGYHYINQQGKKQKFSFWKNNGKTVKIQTPDGYVYSYLHLKNVSVKIGQRVKYNTVIGKLGQTGNSYQKKPSLHIEMYHKGKKIDPLIHLPIK